MIVKMNKYAFLVYHREYKAFLEHLRSLGVVHVKTIRPVSENGDIQRFTDELKRVSAQIDYLSNFEPPARLYDPSSRHYERSEAIQNTATTNIDCFVPRNDETAAAFPETAAVIPETAAALPETILAKTEDLRETLAKTEAALVTLEKERSLFDPWGDFSYETTAKLLKEGYKTSFYTCPAQNYDETWESTYNALIINEINSIKYFVTITKQGEYLAIDADAAKLPLKDFQTISQDIEDQIEIKQTTKYKIAQTAETHLDTLKKYKTEIENELMWKGVEIQTETEAESKLMFLEGWIPASEAANTEAALEKAGCFFKKTEITDEDVIPIKLKNNRFTKLFEPITKLYSLPNYSEIDPTPLFAPFFMLFFGLCFGDGGYGLLLIITSLLLRQKMSATMKPIMTLVLLFGITTLIIGTLTGSFFGCSLVDFPTFAKVKQWFITSDNLMIISLVIGFFHVVYGKIIAAYKIKIQRGLKYSLAAFAWVFVILSLGCVLALPMLKITIPDTLKYIMYAIAGLSGAVALLYNMPGRNIFLNFGAGIWNTYNTVSGLVGDVLSYIRLYAIGLTGALLGGVFNSMAIDMTASMNPFIRWLPMLLILLIGHALNIGLSLISSLVHPLRLIYVEYYKNSEFEGGGLDYQPFRIKN